VRLSGAGTRLPRFRVPPSLRAKPSECIQAMARGDLLLDLVRAGARGDQQLFRKVVEALIAEERVKQHHVLADRLAEYLDANGASRLVPAPASSPSRSASPNELLRYLSPNRGLESLILPPFLEEACRELIEEQCRADLLRSYNIEPRHRILLIGPPGNGKTSLAEALAFELNVPLLVVRYESVIASYLGETALRLAKLFEIVRTQRCVLFFDEFDVVGKERSDVHETGEIKRIVSSLLLQVDALPSYVVVVAATNHPEILDRAAWRRFQVRLNLPMPSVATAGRWFEQFQERARISLGIEPATLAKKLAGLSYSELEQFAQDVQRRVVLDRSSGDAREIVEKRLVQWADRSRGATPDDERG
jgi:hypothetical protein